MVGAHAHLWGDQALDLGGLAVLLAIPLELAAVGVHILAHVILLRAGTCTSA